MKTLAFALLTAAALSVAVTASGHDLDTSAVFSIAFASGLVAMFVRDYSRAPAHRAKSVKTPVRASRPEVRHPEFASVVIFNTTAA